MEQLGAQIVLRVAVKERKELEKEAEADGRKLASYLRKIIKERRDKKK